MTTLNATHPHALELTPDYREPTYGRRLLAMARGLSRPPFSREYKEAVIELQRLSAPLAAVTVPLLIIALVLLLPNDTPMPQDAIEVTLLPPGPPLPPPIIIEQPQTADIAHELPDFELTIPTPETASGLEQPTAPVTAETLANLPVLAHKCPVMLKVLYGEQRSAAGRSALRDQFAGDQASEDAVVRALYWLKANQQPDGSWKSQRIAMTGLAVLTYLAHGEVPDTGKSPEFGDTVGRAIEFLLKSQRPDGRFSGMDGNEYAHPIAAYALCEAYGMTLNPNVKRAAERALVPIIRGQHPTGGWTYKMTASIDPASGRYRDDSSYMGWCAQALKAAHLAGLKSEGLDKAIKLAVRGFKSNANPKGGFGYTGPGQSGLTSVGTLCLQLLGAASEPEVRASLSLMDNWRPSFDEKSAVGNSLQYYSYYTTQAKFHEGGKPWEKWNREMKTVYVKAQQIEKNAAKNAAGKDVDIGWWANQDAHSDRPVMDTCLAALQLMVYYRSLTTTTAAAVAPGPGKALATATLDPNEVPVIVENL